MSLKYVGAREANQQFSALLAATERDGVTIIITRRGKPVARLVREPPVRDAEARRARLEELFRKYSRPLHYTPEPRESLHERGVDL
ncbi:MAG: type II toxin-antitoxin system Phd/YefM family antitoxin [Vulcanimicrobiaceae bacterium]